MRRLVPIFRDAGESFEADTCGPLVEAAGRKEVRLEALVHGHYPGRPLPAGTLPGLKSVGYWDATAPQSWGLPWHRNEGIEITFLESGKLSFWVDEKEYTLQPDVLTLTRPWQKHRLGNPNVGLGKLHWLILDVGVRRPNQAWSWPKWIVLNQKDLDELADIIRQTEQPVWKASTEIRHCFVSVASAVEQDRRGSSASVIAVRINELLLLLLELLRRRKPALNQELTTSRATVQMFLDDLASHPEHLALEWNVQEMAESCGLGVTQFVHIVRQLTNMTPGAFLNQKRLDLAAKLLKTEHSVTVTEIALRCGYSSSQYFSNVFRRRYGCTPTEYRHVVEDLST
jgi:AraC family 4-hydroxyphenylacetate 3-monooxygenase operon regulatory protein